MNAPDFLPVLSAGAHSDPREGACVMEYVSMLAGEPFTDTPACTHPVLARAAQAVNDRLSDEERHLLVPLIGRLFGTADTRTDETERKVLSVRLAVWSARSVAHLVRVGTRRVCTEAIDAAEAWCDNPTEAANAANAANAAAAANAATAYAATANAANAAAAAYAASASAAAYAATTANAYAATAADAAATGGGVGFLTGLLDEYDRLTGHTPTVIPAADLHAVASRVGVNA